MNPKISVIVPVYNTEKWLVRCLDSILAQTFTDFELLLIDDGSTDGSSAICDEYAGKDSRVRVFHKPNGGVSSARNLGLDNAKGRWIAFADSDDIVYPCWLQNFDNTEFENCDLKIQGVNLVSAENQDNQEVVNPIVYDADWLQLTQKLNYTFGLLGVKLFKKKIIDIVGKTLRFDERKNFMEDEDFIIDYMSRIRNAVILPGVGYKYFLPKSEAKYGMYRLEMVPLYLYFIDKVRRALSISGSWLENKYHNFAAMALVNNCRINSCDRKSVRHLRDYIVTNYHQCSIFGPTKFIIAIDPTLMLGKATLKLHLKIKGNEMYVK